MTEAAAQLHSQKRKKKKKRKKWNTLIPESFILVHSQGRYADVATDDEWVTSVRISRETSKRKVGRLYTCGPLPPLHPPRDVDSVCNGRQCRDQ